MVTLTALNDQLTAAESASNMNAVSFCRHILSQMCHHRLEASSIMRGNTTVSIHWISEIHRSRLANIMCCDDGAIIGLSVDGLMGNGGSIRSWYVSDMHTVKPPLYAFPLSLSETLEYIRFLMWAKHD